MQIECEYILHLTRMVREGIEESDFYMIRGLSVFIVLILYNKDNFSR